MNVLRPTAFSATEIQAWRRIRSHRRVTVSMALRRAFISAFGLFVVYLSITRLMGGAW